MRPIQSMIALLFALGSAAALAQNGAAPQPPTGKPVDDSATYGPVLNRQPLPATTQRPTPASTLPAGESRPQAQEERAGQSPVTGKRHEVDPSARPAPSTGQPQQPQTQQAQQPQTQQPQTQQPQTQEPRTQQELRGVPERRQGTKKQAQRRPGAAQRIEGTPRIAAPVPPPHARPAPAPAPPAPGSGQIVGCMGSTCTDASGNTYNAGGPGNAAISSSGRLCTTTNGTHIQCL